MTNQVTLETAPLNASDRCDRCSAQAYVRAILGSGLELLFCGHHAKKYAESLEIVASKIDDQSDRLTEVSAEQ